MKLYLWKNITKKKNSTFVPNTTPDYDLEVDLNEDTSVDTPTFLLDNVDLSCNYAQWEGRYYFVDNIRRGITGQYELECSTDYLATYRSEIGNYTAFVERAASSYDVQINDDSLSQRQTYTIEAKNQAVDTGAIYSIASGGSYMIRVVGKQTITQQQLQGTPGIVSYLLAPWELLEVLDWLFDNGHYTDVLGDPAVKSFFNPFQYIVDVRWLPTDVFQYELEHPNVVKSRIALGWWITDTNGRVIPNTPITWNDKLPLFTPKYNDFRDRNSDWTRFKLFAPLVGNIDIDPSDYYANDLYYRYTFDPILGDGLFTITHGNDKSEGTIYNQSVKYGCQIQIGQVATDLKQSVGSIAGGFASLAAGNFLAAGTSLVSGVMNVLQPTPTVNGHMDGRVGYYYTMYINVERYSADAAEFPTNVNGRPLCKNVKINTLSGFVKCAAASVNISGFAGDKEAVNNALNGGFYYE